MLLFLFAILGGVLGLEIIITPEIVHHESRSCLLVLVSSFKIVDKHVYNLAALLQSSLVLKDLYSLVDEPPERLDQLSQLFNDESLPETILNPRKLLNFIPLGRRRLVEGIIPYNQNLFNELVHFDEEECSYDDEFFDMILKTTIEHSLQDTLDYFWLEGSISRFGDDTDRIIRLLALLTPKMTPRMLAFFLNCERCLNHYLDTKVDKVILSERIIVAYMATMWVEDFSTLNLNERLEGINEDARIIGCAIDSLEAQKYNDALGPISSIFTAMQKLLPNRDSHQLWATMGQLVFICHASLGQDAPICREIAIYYFDRVPPSMTITAEFRRLIELTTYNVPIDFLAKGHKQITLPPTVLPLEMKKDAWLESLELFLLEKNHQAQSLKTFVTIVSRTAEIPVNGRVNSIWIGDAFIATIKNRDSTDEALLSLVIALVYLLYSGRTYDFSKLIEEGVDVYSDWPTFFQSWNNDIKKAQIKKAVKLARNLNLTRCFTPLDVISLFLSVPQKNKNNDVS